MESEPGALVCAEGRASSAPASEDGEYRRMLAAPWQVKDGWCCLGFTDAADVGDCDIDTCDSVWPLHTISPR